MKFKRVILIIIDACGVGELPDAADYGDTGSSTIPNCAAAVGGLNMPLCQSLGLGNIVDIGGISKIENPRASYGKMAEFSSGKDSTIGHWEIAGIQLSAPFPLFPNGFPDDIVKKFESQAGVKTIGNVAASGTEIIEKLGKRHLETRALILYTSADSVFQLAAHEDIYPIDRQYQICQTARDLLIGECGVSRVIARPFIGEPGHFERTVRRKDFSIDPTGRTILDALLDNGMKTYSIGKVYDLFNGRGLSDYVKTNDNRDGIKEILRAISVSDNYQLIFANLVDFDQLWGHRNDESNFARALEEFDKSLVEIINQLNDDDLLIITADHGCDPTIKNSTDHSREYVPLLVYNNQIKKGVNLGIRETFSDIASTIAENFELKDSFPGKSFLNEII